MGHTAAACRGKGKGNGGKGGKGTYSLGTDNGENWASWDDYTAAWGNGDNNGGYTPVVAPIWTMSLRQAKTLVPIKSATVKNDDKRSNKDQGRFKALQGDDSENEEDMPEPQDSN